MEYRDHEREFGLLLKQLRNSTGLTQEETAEKLGVSRKSIDKWELGLNLPTQEKISVLADIYKVDEDIVRELFFLAKSQRKRMREARRGTGRPHQKITLEYRPFN